MVVYFGFTLILTLYILLASVIQGLLIDQICGRSEKCNLEE